MYFQTPRHPRRHIPQEDRDVGTHTSDLRLQSSTRVRQPRASQNQGHNNHAHELPSNWEIRDATSDDERPSTSTFLSTPSSAEWAPVSIQP